MKPRKASATHPGIKVKKSRSLTLFVPTRKRKKKTLPPEWLRPVAQA
jgi:hypothetical protein